MSKKARTIRISIPLGSEVSDQVNDAVRAGKITRNDEKAFWKAFDAYRDEFGNVTFRAEFDKGVTILAGSDKDDSLNQDDVCSECPPFEKEGMTRSVGRNGKWFDEKFTNGKWVRIGKRR